MNIILLGAPGAGKGTQSKIIQKIRHIPHISTGDMLRASIASHSEIGSKIKHLMDAGELVSDKLIIEMVHIRLQKPDCQNGYILDGIPRTLQQAHLLKESGIQINLVIEVKVPDKEVIQRITGRRIHPASGRTYHITGHPPKIAGLDDITNEPLIQRKDDQEAIICNRLKIYHRETKPLIEYYAKAKEVQFFSIDGLDSIDNITKKMTQIIQNADLSASKIK